MLETGNWLQTETVVVSQTGFTLFGGLHVAILIATFVSGPALARITRQSPRQRTIIRRVLASILSAIGLTWYVYRFGVQHVRWVDGLPLEVSDISLWLAVIALITLQQSFFELSYYWGLSGASMAMLTPILTGSIAEFPSVVFLAGHGLLVASIFYLVCSHEMRPRRNSWWGAFCLLNAYTVFVGLVDHLARTNYMYLRSKPAKSSLLDFFGPWPWYLLVGDIAALLIFFVMGLPFQRREQVL